MLPMVTEVAGTTMGDEVGWEDEVGLKTYTSYWDTFACASAEVSGSSPRPLEEGTETVMFPVP
jgi:hypothetical protein